MCKGQLLYGAAHAQDVGDDQPAPKAVIAEGIAANALDMAIRRMGSPPVLQVLGDPGITVDPRVAVVVHRGEWSYLVAANAVRMLHEEGITPAVAEAFVRESASEPPDRTAKTWIGSWIRASWA